MYKILVRSHLDYYNIIHHIPSVQTQFGVTLTDLMEKGSWQGSSRSKLYEELGWETLSGRR